MRREFFIHFSFFVSFFIFVSLVRGWLHLSYWPLWLGGLLGTFLPDIDHLLYVYFLKPEELTSQRARHMMAQKDILGAFRLLADTREERSKLVFHSTLFQIIFLVLTFLVVTSSSSIFGRGLVLSFFLHLAVDQAIDLSQTGGLDNWFGGVPYRTGKKEARIFLTLVFLTLLFFGFLL